MTKRPFSTATVFITLLGLFFLMPSALRAQTCALDPLSAGRAAGMSATSFLPNGREGQILVRFVNDAELTVKSMQAPDEALQKRPPSEQRPGDEDTYPFGL